MIPSEALGGTLSDPFGIFVLCLVIAMVLVWAVWGLLNWRTARRDRKDEL